MKMRQYGYSYFLEMIRIFIQVVCTIVLAVSAVLEACTPVEPNSPLKLYKYQRH